jgi:mRNA interferase RelE/StbE
VKYSVLISPPAQRQIKKLSISVQQQIISKLKELEATPRPQGVEKLWDNENLYRIRTGDYRIVYQINDQEHSIIVAKVAHRKEVYRRF